MKVNPNDHHARRDISNPYEMHATIARLTEGMKCRTLWRMDTAPNNNEVHVLVQTTERPDPARIIQRSEGYLKAFDTRENQLVRNLTSGDRVRFRVRANPTVKRDNKRHALVKLEEQLAWLDRVCGFRGARVISPQVVEARKFVIRKRQDEHNITVYGVTFEGDLLVVDAEAVRGMIRGGIGRAKGLGFGLVTVARH